METLEHELMDQCDAKEVAHDLPESVSIRDLKTLLPPEFCEQVHMAVSERGYLSEHQWRSGPMLVVRFIMGPEASSQVQIGENVNGNALTIATELDEAVKALLPAEHKAGIQVWHHRPTLDRWNEQWVFETLIAAADKVLEESIHEVSPPTGLSEDGVRAWQAIVNILQQESALPSEKIIFTGQEWQEREGERLGAELVVLHENGDHCPYFNLNFQGHLMHAKMDLALRNAGFRMESQANWYSAIFKAPVADTVLAKLNENDEEDFGDEDRDVFEPGGTREDRIRHLFQNAGLHIKNMIEIPADPGWGALGKPKQTIDSVLQPDESKPWSTNGLGGVEFSDFCRRIMSNLGQILETTDVDFTTKFNQELNSWEIRWYIGLPEGDRGKLRENDEDFDDVQDVEPPEFQAGDIVRRPNSHWPEMTGRITHCNGYVYGEPRNITWWVDWGKDPSLDGPVPTSDLELVERPEPIGESFPADEFAGDDEDAAKDVWVHNPPTVNITHMFRLHFDFGAGEGKRELVWAVPADLLPPPGPDGDTEEIERFVREYARQNLTDVPKDDWDFLVAVEPVNPERLVSELGESEDRVPAQAIEMATQKLAELGVHPQEIKIFGSYPKRRDPADIDLAFRVDSLEPLIGQKIPSAVEFMAGGYPVDMFFFDGKDWAASCSISVDAAEIRMLPPDQISPGLRRVFKPLVKEDLGEENEIQLHQSGEVMWIDWFHVPPPHYVGRGRAAYQEFESSLPKEIKVVRLQAGDAGDGNSEGFWEKMGFSHVYATEQGDQSDFEMWKGVNGNPTPESIAEDLNAEVVDAAKEADKEPSDEQKEAGNYQKGHVTVQGLDISIENAKGSMRRGKDKDGKEWEVKLPAHYGYIVGFTV